MQDLYARTRTALYKIVEYGNTRRARMPSGADICSPFNPLREAYKNLTLAIVSEFKTNYNRDGSAGLAQSKITQLFGRDILIGGAGDDTLTGGTGSDRSFSSST